MAVTYGEIVARDVVGGLELYAALGLVFAIGFVGVGVHKLDPAARGTSIGFRLLILPGVAALWPMFLARWTRGQRNAQQGERT